MNKSTLRRILMIYLVVFCIHGEAAIDSDAAVVYLRSSCNEGVDVLNNCFTTTVDLANWLYNVRDTAAGPLTVEIGPGRFAGFECISKNDLSLKGSGPGVSILGGPGNSIGIRGAGCFNFNVQDLTAESNFISVRWDGKGSSNWSNVHVMPNSLTLDGLFKQENTYGWSESCVGITKADRPVHRWSGSRILATGKTAYLATCSENWFFGTQIEANGAGAADGLRGVTVSAIEMNQKPEIHLYGSNLRVVAAQGVSFPTPAGKGDGIGILAAGVGLNGELHMHGTGIDAIGNELPNDIAALAVDDGGTIHATQAAFVMKTPSPGKVYRIKNDGGTVMAPYLWEERVLSINLVSEDGADTTTDIVGGLPHTMIYTGVCNANGPWFDTVTGQCRQ